MNQFLKVTITHRDGDVLSPTWPRIISTVNLVGDIAPLTEGNGATAAIFRLKENRGGSISEHDYRCSETFNQLASVIEGGSDTPFALGDLLALFDVLNVQDQTFPYIDASSEAQLAPLPDWALNLLGLAAAANRFPMFSSGTTATMAVISDGMVDLLSKTPGGRKIPSWSDSDNALFLDYLQWFETFLALTPAADQMVYYSGANTAVLTAITAFGRALLQSGSLEAARTAVGVKTVTGNMTGGTTGAIAVTGITAAAHVIVSITDANSSVAVAAYYTYTFNPNTSITVVARDLAGVQVAADNSQVTVTILFN
jgi:hypothetical protein